MGYDQKDSSVSRTVVKVEDSTLEIIQQPSAIERLDRASQKSRKEDVRAFLDSGRALPA